jgi:Uma2 family endonuclease
MAILAPSALLADDLWDTPDDGKLYEIIDGKLTVSPAPSWTHQQTLGNLYLKLRPYVREHDLGEVGIAPLGVILDRNTAVQPDLLFVSKERRSIISERGVEGPPDLVAEVLSPGTRARDRGLKLRTYAAAGVKWHWMLDPSNHTVEERELVNGAYMLRSTSGPGMTFRPLLFPGLEIPVDELWI